MRDTLIEEIYRRMEEDDSIFFLTADFGAPRLDDLRRDFSDRFINVGIAEQNLINIATGLALEGYTVYAYAIAPFITMRAYEQVRNNLSLLGSIREVNVNMVGVGAGLSYDVSGPTHHCIEDITIMRNLPNISIFSPSDCEMVRRFVDYTLWVKRPKYLRFDSRPLPPIYRENDEIDLEKGFHVLREGEGVCLVATGYMTHTALEVRKMLEEEEGIRVGVVDLFLLRPLDKESLFRILEGYDLIASLEEGFINKGGLDSLLRSILGERGFQGRMVSFGFEDAYTFEVGGREALHRVTDVKSIAGEIKRLTGRI